MDLLALDWVSPTVVATGFRNSLVGLYDVRSSGFATRIQHPRSVGPVKSADENRLVVAGYRSLRILFLPFFLFTKKVWKWVYVTDFFFPRCKCTIFGSQANVEFSATLASLLKVTTARSGTRLI
jgi:hypothetical protein